MAVDDPIELAGKLAAHRRAREFEPARAALKAAVEAKVPEAVAARMAKLADFTELVNDWQDDIAGLSSGKLKAVLKAGATVTDYLPSKKKKKIIRSLLTFTLAHRRGLRRDTALTL